MVTATTSLNELITQMLALQRALPTRPSFPELEIALHTIAKIDVELAASQKEFLQHPKPEDVPGVVFSAFQEMHLEAAEHKAKEQKQAAKGITELEERHRKYDRWIWKVHAALSSDNVAKIDADVDVAANVDEATTYGDNIQENFEKVETNDDQGSARSVLDAAWEFPPLGSSVTSSVGMQASIVDDHGLMPTNSKFSAFQHSDSFSRVAHSLSWNKERSKSDLPLPGEGIPNNPSLFVSVVDGTIRATDERNSLVLEKVKETAGLLSMLDLASRQKQTCLNLRGELLREIEWVPDSIGKMTWLTTLDLSGNRLCMLPDSIGDLVNLVNMDVSLNQLITLPETIGQLTCLKTLILDNNKIEELPYTIGQCASLVELRASFNHLKALPEATGRLTQLRCIDVHFNKLGSLPTTMASLASLVDLDASFNEIHHIPEALCEVTTLTRLNLSSNFNELQELPRSVGNLQKLKVLNLSCNQLRVLPDSLALLTNLQHLDLSENPLRVPPKHIADQGTEVVLKYMASLVAEKVKGKPVVRKTSRWTSLFFMCGKPSVIEADDAVR